MEQMAYRYFAGIDWATQKHDIAVIEADGKKVFEGTFENSFDGLKLMAERLSELCQAAAANMAIAIEVPHGPVVELLVERGFPVYAVNPKQLDRFRDRHTTIGAKDDRLDAFVLADSARTDLHCFRRVKLAGEDVIKLRSLSRLHDDLKVTVLRLAAQLREQLMRYAPHLLKLCPAADKVWFWDLLGMAAHPTEAAKIKRSKVEKFITSHRLRKLKVDDILAALEAPALVVAPGVVEASVTHVSVLRAQLEFIEAQRKGIERHLSGILETMSQPGDGGEHRDAAILLSLPGVGELVAATMLTEASQAIAERDYETLRAQAGVAPVTKRSGKRLVVGMRYACSHRLRNAIYHWSRVSVQVDPISRHKYATLRAKGQSHGRALRSIGDGLLRILFGMLKSRTTFDPTLREKLVA